MRAYVRGVACARAHTVTHMHARMHARIVTPCMLRWRARVHAIMCTCAILVSVAVACGQVLSSHPHYGQLEPAAKLFARERALIPEQDGLPSAGACRTVRVQAIARSLCSTFERHD